jgi:ATP-dependent Lhr-like helicase
MLVQEIIDRWYQEKGWQQFPFQREMMKAYIDGYSGLLNAPTGSGKTYGLWLPILAEYISQHTDYNKPKKNNLQVLWITPLRALAKDIQQAMQCACDEMGIPWKVATRTGDTSSAEKARQKSQLPECLITTPESLHLLLSQKGYKEFFKDLKTVVIDEWHELLGTKRGVQVELALSRLKQIQPDLKLWGISATIGNLDEALKVLAGANYNSNKYKIIKAETSKKIKVETILPEEIEKFSWAGHLGLKLLPQIIQVIDQSKTTLVFTNTRSQTEIWYQHLLLHAPHLAGVIAFIMVH